MSLASLTVLATWLQTTQSHMSMQFPYPRDTLSSASYAVWQQNEPMWSVHPTVCHGLDEDTTVRTGNAFAAGDFVEIDIYGSAPHDGGHCAFWWTTDTSGDWYKIIDIKDCTLADSFNVMMPFTMATDCATKCTFAFTWVPVSSGACEVYMNCAEVSVSGVTGASQSATTKNFATDMTGGSFCSRVDDTTHWTTIFGTIKESYTTEDANGGETSVGDTPDVTVDDTEIAEEIEDDTEELCSNPNAPNLDGTISNIGECGTNLAGSRCDDGQCCSSAGYCGPELDGYDGDGNPQYIDYDTNSDGSVYYSSEALAFAAYCDANLQGDWRLVDCSSLTDGDVATASTTSAGSGDITPADDSVGRIDGVAGLVLSLCVLILYV